MCKDLASRDVYSTLFRAAKTGNNVNVQQQVTRIENHGRKYNCYIKWLLLRRINETYWRPLTHRLQQTPQQTRRHSAACPFFQTPPWPTL